MPVPEAITTVIDADKSDLQKVLETQSRKELKTKNYSSRLTAR